MLIAEDFKNDMNVKWATPNTVCHYCLVDLLNANKNRTIDEMNPVIARNQLAGKLYGQKVWAIGDKFICCDHIKKAYNLMISDKEENTNE